MRRVYDGFDYQEEMAARGTKRRAPGCASPRRCTRDGAEEKRA
jgi:hypothetical protein